MASSDWLVKPMMLNTWTTNKETMTNAQEIRLWFVLRLFYCLVCASCYFFLPPSDEVAASFSHSFETLPLLHLHSNAKLLHSYKIALSATSLPSKLQKTSLAHPHPIPRWQCQIFVSEQRALTKHFLPLKCYLLYIYL